VILWIRADATPAVGLGHVMRTLALAEEARDVGLIVRFVTLQGSIGEHVLRQRRFEPDTIEDRDEVGWISLVSSGDSVVFDGYGLDPGAIAVAKRRGATVMVLDDGTEEVPAADIVLNQNLPQEDYRPPDGARALIGPRYALIRKEFRARRRLRAGSRHGRLVLTFGGSDPTRLGEKVLSLLDEQPPSGEVLLIRGPSTPPSGRHRPWLVERRSDDLAADLDAATAVISAGGTTTWELLCMGLPSGLIEVVANQRHAGRAAAAAGAALFLGTVDNVASSLHPTLGLLSDDDTARRLSEAALGLVDGRGARRVLDALTETSV
jgi:UDP-2,4-diacetamido-2,4,6-trideoxy-beta-L-altropyranose hydrolase